MVYTFDIPEWNLKRLISNVNDDKGLQRGIRKSLCVATTQFLISQDF